MIHAENIGLIRRTGGYLRKQAKTVVWLTEGKRIMSIASGAIHATHRFQYCEVGYDELVPLGPFDESGASEIVEEGRDCLARRAD